MPKKTKAEVDYSKGMAGERCGLCEHFRSPDSCTLVEGDIRTDYWCKLFKGKPRARSFSSMPDAA